MVLHPSARDRRAAVEVVVIRTIAEAVLGRRSRPADLPTGLPSDLLTYAVGFLDTSRDSLRFLWRDGQRWLAVQLVRSRPTPATSRPAGSTGSARPAASAGSAGSAGSETVSLRVAEVDIPQGVTPREVDILTLLALGLTNAGIAERLGTSARTVSTQIERLLAKLDQVTRGGLSALAVDSGLIRLPIPGGVDGSAGIGIVELESVVTMALRPTLGLLTPAYPRKAPLLIGLLVPTGIAGSDGVEFRNGAMLAVEQVNAAGGVAKREIAVVAAEVDLFSGDSIDRGLDRLFAAGVDAIITSYASAENATLLDRVADYGRPFLHTATFAEQVSLAEANPRRYGAILQTCASETYYGVGLIDLLTQLGARGLFHPTSHTIVSIETESSSTHVTNEAFLDAAQAAGWSLAQVIHVPVIGADWDAVAAALARAEPDVVMVTHFLDTEIARFQRAFLAVDSCALVYCVYGASIPGFLDAAGEAAEGVIWSTTTGTYDDELGRRFRAQYEARFGCSPGWSQAGAAYDQVNLLAGAWSATATWDTAEVIGHLRRRPHRGVNGVYYFGEHSQSTLSYPHATSDASLGQAHMVYQIQDGTHTPLAPEPFGDLRSFRMPPWCRSHTTNGGDYVV